MNVLHSQHFSDACNECRVNLAHPPIIYFTTSLPIPNPESTYLLSQKKEFRNKFSNISVLSKY